MRKFFLLLLFLLFLIPTQSSYASGENWLTGWSYRKKITISPTNVGSSSLSYFPLLVRFSSNTDIGNALATGYDIRFTSDDGKTLLSYERDSWTGGGGTAGTGAFWVKVSTITTGTNTIIYMYYGNTSSITDWTATSGADTDATNCGSITPAQCTWKEGASQNYAAVWHLNSLSNLNDSTTNGNNCTNTNATADSGGKIGGAISFLASSFTSLDCGNRASLTFTTAFSVEEWAKPSTTTGGWYTMVNKGGFSGSGKGWLTVLFKASPNPHKFYYIDVPGPAYETTNAIPGSVWSYLAFTDNNGAVKLYNNGAPDGTGNTPITNATENLLMGARWSGVSKSDFYSGLLDEVRISSSVRSADWLKFGYCNTLDSASGTCFGENELTVANQETPPVTASSSVNTAPTPTPGLFSCTAGQPGSAPTLFQVNRNGEEVTVYFTPVSGQKTGYTVSYGKNIEADQYAVTFDWQDSNGVIPYTIRSLSLGDVWYFKVRGMNGCKPGDWSAIMSTTKTVESGGDAFSLQTEESIVPTETPTPTPASMTYAIPTVIPSPMSDVKGEQIERNNVKKQAFVFPKLSFSTIHLPSIHFPTLSFSFVGQIQKNMSAMMQSVKMAYKGTKELFIDNNKSMADKMMLTSRIFATIWFSKDPTKIQNVRVKEQGSDYAVITWETNQLATSKVSWGDSYDYGKSIESNSFVTTHELRINGLTKGNTYYYEVMSEGKNYVFDARHEFVFAEKEN